jgi:site-specific recombinase XerD
MLEGSALFSGSDLVCAYAHQARAGNTHRSYTAQWQQFLTWCGRTGAIALPADPRLVAEYVAQRARAGSAVASIDVMLAAIGFMHKKGGVDFARHDPTLTLVLDGIRRAHVRLQQQAQPLTGTLLAEVLANIGDEPRDLRDAALLSLLYGFAARAAEL